MAAAYRTLDLTLLSAKDLKDVNVFSKMDVYAVVCIAGEPRSVQRTPIEKNAGKKPSWNATLRFFVPDDPAAAAGLVVHVALRSKRILGDRDIGDVHIPVQELLDEGGDKHSESPQILSYQVHKPKSRKPKGVISISYKFYDPPAVADPDHTAAPPTPVTDLNNADPPTPYPALGSSATAYPPHGPLGTYTQSGAPPQYASAPPHYGYVPPAAGHCYAPPTPAKHDNFGTGLGAGLLGGVIGGVLLGDMASDAAAYDAGFADDF